jgi:hypothetical protein
MPSKPPPRSRAEVQSILTKAPKPEGSLRPLNILLVAGPKDHGLAQHDYPQWQRDWQPLMSKLPNVAVTTAWKWPTKEQLANANLLVCYFKSPWTAEQVNDVKALHARGGGLVTLHWAIAPDNDQSFDLHQQVTGLDYKSAGYRHGELDIKFHNTNHPILLGFPPTLHLADESYFPIIGDRSKSPPWEMAQRLDTDLGKMIHITPNGDPAPNNPFLGKTGILPEIWSSGHRSEEGLTIDPATGRLWEVEDGPRGGDELNTPEAGKNYGWPVIVHGIDYPGQTIGEGIVDKQGMEQPHYYWDPVIAPSGLAFYTGNLFPQWKGSLFVGALRGQMLDRLTLDGDKVVAEEPLLADQHSRIRDVRIGPEGAVYVITDEGKLLKLTPK